MTSALDANGERILGSPAGDVITQKVLNDGEEYFTRKSNFMNKTESEMDRKPEMMSNI